MVQRFIAWWIRNAAYIGPVANLLSAFAALLSVYMVMKTFKQARKDRQEELETKHPRFIFDSFEIKQNPLGLGSYSELCLNLKNIREHSAERFKLVGTVFLDPQQPLLRCEYEPTDYLEKDGTIQVSFILLELSISDEPYLIRLAMSYTDAHTQKKHQQTLWRQLRYTSGEPLGLLPVNETELTTRFQSIRVGDNS
jgi:hypothetical protein